MKAKGFIVAAGIGIVASAHTVTVARADSFGGLLEPSQRVGPPSAHSHLGDYGSETSSWLERTTTFDDAGAVVFRYFVDSEEGHDALEVSVDGAVSASFSGRQRTGRYALPVGAGSHTIRFSYRKDASGDDGLDTAWIDDVELIAGPGPFERYSFERVEGGGSTGWAAGGYAGGWGPTFGPEWRLLRRPPSMAFAGDQTGPTRAAMTRTFTWPTDTSNALAVSYYVDSEPEADELRVFVDGSLAWSISGLAKKGVAKIPVNSGGAHEVTLEYLKNEAVDLGRDEARIDYIVPTAGGIPFDTGGFAGAALGELPYGWAEDPSANAGPWEIVVQPAPFAALVRAPALPVVDGSAGSSEYALGLILSANHMASLPARNPRIKMTSYGTRMYWQVELPDQLGEWFLAGGMLALYVDVDARRSSLGLGCGALGSSPGSAARRVHIEPVSAGGTVLVDVSQQVGDCWAGVGSAWREATDAEAWDAEAVALLDSESGSVLLEVGVDVQRPADVAETDPVGFQLTLDGVLPTVGREELLRVPWRVDRELDPTNAATWEQVFVLDPAGA